MSTQAVIDQMEREADHHERDANHHEREAASLRAGIKEKKQKRLEELGSIHTLLESWPPLFSRGAAVPVDDAGWWLQRRQEGAPW